MVRNHLKTVLVALAIAAIAAIALLVFAIDSDWSTQCIPPIRLQFIDTAVQVLVVAIIGSLSALLADGMQKSRERENAERELRIIAMRRPLSAYAGAKKVRRQLRSGLDARDLFVPLNDAHLEFESLKREVENAPIFANPAGIVAAFKEMEKYLKAVIDLLENPSAATSWQYPFNARTQAPLADFTGPYTGSGFEAHFAHAFDVVLARMQAEIVRRPPTFP